MKNLIIIFLIISAIATNAQFGRMNEDNQWDASWICVPETNPTAPGLFLFRKTLNLEAVPQRFEVRVSADNRYKLYINGVLASLGPALGDIKHWNYETVDLAPFLKKGDNIISAEVWNEGNLKPVSQFSYRTGFILQGTNAETKALNTNESWRCTEDKSYTPIVQNIQGYYAAGAGDKIDMKLAVKGWKLEGFDDSNWKVAKPVFENAARGFGFNTRGGWTLTPSTIPPMEMTMQRLMLTRKTAGVAVPAKFPAEKVPVNIPANTKASILLDQSFLTNAYLTLVFSKGNNSTIVITYSEGLYDEKGAKNNRDEIEGKTILGRRDTIISDGSTNQSFTTLSWRTYRYIEIKVETRDMSLVIEDIYGTFTGYPFKMNAKLESDIPEMNKMMEIGWRTARLCAVDTYMDCPYYERLQYIGDARIQMMVSYYNSGDDRQAKNALTLWNNSRQPDGYTLSRYPDTQNQVIPTYSLWYISALHDYLLYGSDKKFLKTKLLGSRQIMNYFISFLSDDGSLKNVPGWNFTDWVPDWWMGIAPAGEDGSSAALDLQLMLALQSGIALEKVVGSQEYAALYDKVAQKLKETIQSKYWDNNRKMYADTPQRDKFSQHTNSMAILAGLVDHNTASGIAQTMLSDRSLSQASIYFKYYLHLALVKAGFGDDYLSWLDIWRKNMVLGLTTWGETSEVETTRSDCHAWGASPNIEFFRTVLGVESAAPYFSRVKIEPHLGSIIKIAGEMPHPSGKILVSYKRKGKSLNVQISLPENLSGEFVWEGKSYNLKGGENHLLCVPCISSSAHLM